MLSCAPPNGHPLCGEQGAMPARRHWGPPEPGLPWLTEPVQCGLQEAPGRPQVWPTWLRVPSGGCLWAFCLYHPCHHQ